MGKHKKHKHGHRSSSSSSSSSSDEEFKHLPKAERKMRKKMKKQMKKGKIPHGMVPGAVPPHGSGYPGGQYPTGQHYPAGQQYPTNYPQATPGAYPPAGGSYPAAPPPAAGYSGGGFSQPGAVPGGYPAPAPGYPAAPQPSYPQGQGYPGNVPPPAQYPAPGGIPGQYGEPTAQGYPGQQPPPVQGGYPGQKPPPAQGGYPGQQPPPPQGGYPAQGGYAGQQAPPAQGYQQGGYGAQQPPPQGYSTQPGYGAPGSVSAATSGMGNLHIGGGSTADLPRPTVRPANPFSCERDTEILRKAMKGIGTDEKAIIDVVTARSNKQRQDILVMFKTMYGKDLIHDLKSELSGDLEEVILALFKPTTYYDAWSLHKAMSGVGTKESVLIEILCTRTNVEVKEIKSCYKQHFGRDLEKDCMDETSGHFKRLLVSCCQGNRTELTPDQQQKLYQQGPEAVVDRALAQQDAQKLYQAGAKKIGTDESAFLAILSIRHQYQMRATFEEYQKLSGKDILSAISSEMSGDLEDGFKAIIMSAKNRPKYFSDKLHKAMKGFGTRDSDLIRILVSRSEIDLQNIKEQYMRDHGKTLQSAVASETSGDYKKLLLGIIGQ